MGNVSKTFAFTLIQNTWLPFASDRWIIKHETMMRYVATLYVCAYDVSAGDDLCLRRSAGHITTMVIVSSMGLFPMKELSGFTFAYGNRVLPVGFDKLSPRGSA